MSLRNRIAGYVFCLLGFLALWFTAVHGQQNRAQARELKNPSIGVREPRGSAGVFTASAPSLIVSVALVGMT